MSRIAITALPGPMLCRGESSSNDGRTDGRAVLEFVKCIGSAPKPVKCIGSAPKPVKCIGSAVNDRS